MTKRTYRTFIHHEAVLRICCDAFDVVTEEIVRQRRILEDYIHQHPAFGASFEPVELLSDAPEVAQRMALTASITAVALRPAHRSRISVASVYGSTWRPLPCSLVMVGVSISPTMRVPSKAAMAPVCPGSMPKLSVTMCPVSGGAHLQNSRLQRFQSAGRPRVRRGAVSLSGKAAVPPRAQTGKLVAISAAEALGRLGDRRGLRLAAEYLVSDRPLNRRAARAVGVIVGQDFRPNSEGLTAARAYLKKHGS